MTTPSAPASELLPCPFCGKSPSRQLGGSLDIAICRTEACPLRGLLFVTNAWNRRALSRPADGVEALGRQALAQIITTLFEKRLGHGIGYITPQQSSAVGFEIADTILAGAKDQRHD